ncbi:MAG: response regulator [Candidatus Marinimicrobia bacterium]|jgi:DNA-binding NtrC family response regulator|nr:response regulator [Candidatus Neomarinimicrobiota bacterium]MCK9483805.1 response regulator [Candidatus Neomarinimicrobiota bacterium]MCK9559158.1 response regulator [Candidatus Neomarinimicrobiota bacterium]MDD5061185.1 response regulator [Candidatus Neomarinimicrobiota bacterium]MDD5539743.1 response regulator [Candidatus Neomarinimicrobiota bacterium]
MDKPKKFNVLVVDDDQSILDVFCNMFEDSPFKIITALDGQEAIEKLQSQPCVLAFIDVIMPLMDGLQTLNALKEIQPSLVAVMISGFRNEHLLENAIKMGAYDYLYKPLDRQDLLSVMVKCLKRLGFNNYIEILN